MHRYLLVLLISAAAVWAQIGTSTITTSSIGGQPLMNLKLQLSW